MRGFCPIASSAEYPVILSNAGFRYSIFASLSVMTMASSHCAIAVPSINNSVSLLFSSVMSVDMPHMAYALPSESKSGNFTDK